MESQDRNVVSQLAALDPGALRAALTPSNNGDIFCNTTPQGRALKEILTNVVNTRDTRTFGTAFEDIANFVIMPMIGISDTTNLNEVVPDESGTAKDSPAADLGLAGRWGKIAANPVNTGIQNDLNANPFWSVKSSLAGGAFETTQLSVVRLASYLIGDMRRGVTRGDIISLVNAIKNNIVLKLPPPATSATFEIQLGLVSLVWDSIDVRDALPTKDYTLSIPAPAAGGKGLSKKKINKGQIKDAFFGAHNAPVPVDVDIQEDVLKMLRHFVSRVIINLMIDAADNNLNAPAILSNSRNAFSNHTIAMKYYKSNDHTLSIASLMGGSLMRKTMVEYLIDLINSGSKYKDSRGGNTPNSINLIRGNARTITIPGPASGNVDFDLPNVDMPHFKIYHAPPAKNKCKFTVNADGTSTIEGPVSGEEPVTELDSKNNLKVSGVVKSFLSKKGDFKDVEPVGRLFLGSTTSERPEISLASVFDNAMYEKVMEAVKGVYVMQKIMTPSDPQASDLKTAGVASIGRKINTGPPRQMKYRVLQRQVIQLKSKVVSISLVRKKAAENRTLSISAPSRTNISQIKLDLLEGAIARYEALPNKYVSAMQQQSINAMFSALYQNDDFVKNQIGKCLSILDQALHEVKDVHKNQQTDTAIQASQIQPESFTINFGMILSNLSVDLLQRLRDMSELRSNDTLWPGKIYNQRGYLNESIALKNRDVIDSTASDDFYRRYQESSSSFEDKIESLFELLEVQAITVAAADIAEVSSATIINDFENNIGILDNIVDYLSTGEDSFSAQSLLDMQTESRIYENILKKILYTANKRQ